MKIGTKCLLFGTHQFILHPAMVAIAWWKLYKRPTFAEVLAIIIHDWGYWGVAEIDGPDDRHTKWAADYLHNVACSARVDGEPDSAMFAAEMFEASRLCLRHSRFYAKQLGEEPSKLCWPDKLAYALLPSWLWATLARMSGELDVYRNNPKYETYQDNKASGIEWHRQYKAVIMPLIEREAALWRILEA